MGETGGFLPTNLTEMRDRGWDRADFVYVSGDAYVDHPSFGAAIITRVLEDAGYRVAFIAQPDWKDDTSICVCGEPRLAFLVSAGNMDSMVNHYTSAKKRRHRDAYTPGGGFSRRPDRAVTVYGNLIRKTYKKVPILLGGVEASLRRLAHYDYWSDKVKRSVLLDSGADLLMYGMGEHAVLEIAEALKAGMDVRCITEVRGTVFRCRDPKSLSGPCEVLPSYADVSSSKKKYAQSYFLQYKNTDALTAVRLAEPYKETEYVIQNPPALPLTTEEMDHVYALPYRRSWHPSYDGEGGVPALNEVKFSLTSSRGCFGGCNFCALTFHQGRRVQARSHESLLAEARRMTREPDFKGYIHDVGGPTANFRHPSCEKQITAGVCAHRQCLFPKPCPHLDKSHEDYVTLLRKLRGIRGVKKVFIRSGIRFDYVMADKDGTFLRELCTHHVSGQLKVAPEHICDGVLQRMGKPPFETYRRFADAYAACSRRAGKKQYLVPYLMSSHPGSGLLEAVALAEYVRDLRYMPEQVQDFYPTPGTVSTCMYYTGLDPVTMEEVYVPRTSDEKKMQRALLQYQKPENYAIVKKALKKAGREDLIGEGAQCLISPRPPGTGKERRPRISGSRGTSEKPGFCSREITAGNSGKRKKKTIRNIHKKKEQGG